MQLLDRITRRLRSINGGGLHFIRSHVLPRFLTSQPKGPMAKADKHLTLGDDYLDRFEEIVVIGDIHGCSEEFEEALDQIHQNSPSKDPNRCLKIIVGDLVNKGPNSKRVLDVCMNKYPNSILSVRGNHDEIVISLYSKFKKEGIRPDPRSKWVEKLSERYISYLESLPYSISIPELNSIIVHAGVDPSREKPAIETPPSVMTTMRNIEVKRDPKTSNTYYDCTKEDRGAAWATFWPGPEHVYFGHDAKRRLQDDHEFATGLDTGCVYGDRLSFIYIKGPKKGEIFSVKAKKIYEQVKGELYCKPS